jgi:hypothetical protein
LSKGVVSGWWIQSSQRTNIDNKTVSFIRHLFLDSSWRENDRTLLQNLSQASGPAEAGIRPNPLPSAAVARLLFDK